jgi:hypothetical protein
MRLNWRDISWNDLNKLISQNQLMGLVYQALRIHLTINPDPVRAFCCAKMNDD